METEQQTPTTANPSTESPIPVTEILKEASKIKEYRGNRDYALSSFLREVELFLPVFENTGLQAYVFQRCVINKIQGAALDVIRTLGPDANWKQIKKELIYNFGVRETYHQLYHNALSLKNYNVSQYYYNLSSILNKLNEKYEQDTNKPVEFNPKNNESMILKTFLNNIQPYMASIIYSRNITSIRAAFYTLEETGIIKQTNNHSYNKQIPNREQYSQSNHIGHHTQPSYSGQPYNQKQFRQTSNSGQFRQTNNSGQFRQTNNSGQIRQSNNTGLYRHSNFPRNEQHGQTSGQVRNQFRQNHVEPMEVDHIDEENFRSPAAKLIYR